MLNRISKKTWALIAAALVLVIALLVFSTAVSDAMTLKEAEDLAVSTMPSGAQYVDGEEGDNKFEILFHDKDLGMKYKVEISKKTEEIRKVEAKADQITHTDKVVIKASEVESLIKSTFQGVNVVKIELEKEKGDYEYEISFTADNYYGDAEINPETGKINEFTVKTGSAVTVPENSGNTGSDEFMSFDQARELAIKTAGGGTIKDIDLDEEKGDYFYEVEVIYNNTEYEYVINAKTKEIVSEDQFEQFFEDKYDDDDDDDMDDIDDADMDDDDDNDDDLTTEQQNQAEDSQSLISKEKAIAIAEKKAPGAEITDIELEKEHGKYVYEIEAEDGTYEYDIEIDAASGVILDFDKEYDDDHDCNDHKGHECHDEDDD